MNRYHLFFLALGMIVPGGQITAQAVRGVVTAQETEVPVSGAEVTLTPTSGDSIFIGVTSADGDFQIEAGDAGEYTLSVRGVGFKPASFTVELLRNATLQVEVTLAPHATLLDPLIVTGSHLTPEQLEFESRKDSVSWGFFLDSADIHEMIYTHVGMYDKVPLARFRCLTSYLDGVYDRTYTGDYPLEWTYGIEIYLDFYDIPIRYRNPDYAGCGAILRWSNRTPEMWAAPQAWNAAFGLSLGAERWFGEIGWRPGYPAHFVTAIRIRFGTYDPQDLLGVATALEEGYDAGARPIHASVYVGKQGPLSGRLGESVYVRIALGGTLYGGQRGEPIGADFSSVRDAPFRAGIGGDAAIGVRVPGTKLRPLLEIRSGTEYLTGIGFRIMKPVLAVGTEFTI